jgi:hypothetical protein
LSVFADPAIKSAINVTSPGVDYRGDDDIAQSRFPDERFKRRDAHATCGMSRGESVHCRQPNSKAGERSGSSRGCKHIDVRKLER